MNALPWALWAMSMSTNIVLLIRERRQRAVVRRYHAALAEAVADGKRAADACDEAIDAANRYREQLFRREGRSN